MRRVLRIWPVYFFVIFIGFIFGTRFHATFLDKALFPYKIDVFQLKWYLSFLANYDLILNGIKSSLVSILWSVAIEEQFYLVWPLMFLIFNKKAIPYICYITIIISFVFRCNHHAMLNFSTMEVMSDLALGGLLAYYCLNSDLFLSYFKDISKSKIIMVYFVLFVFVPLKGFSHFFGGQIFKIYYPFESLIFSLIFGFIILEQNFSVNSFYKFGKISMFNKLGKISYGLYAYHMLTFPIALYVADKLNLPNNQLNSYLLKILISFVLTVIIANLSYNFVEKKILRLKKYFTSY